MEFGTIAVVGAGAWGTALANRLVRRNPRTRIWVREPELAERMREQRDNPLYLPGVRLDERLAVSTELPATVAGADLVLATVPAQYARGVYRELVATIAPGVPIVVACKGIEEGSRALPVEVAAEECGADRPMAVLSGPSFAPEVARGSPTAVVIASTDARLARAVQERLSSRTLRLYTNEDPVGVQVCGALKNVMAIAAGVEDSLGMGTNARAALITRGLAEMARLGAAMGGRASTFSGLAGIGDLVLTCTGELSRNRKVGQRIGRGERLRDILSVTRSVAEGVRTTVAARDLARQHGVEMPIVEEVHGILYEERAPREALDRLLARPLTSEEEPARRGDA